MEQWIEENQRLMERYCLAVGRIEQMLEEKTVQEPFLHYFHRAAQLLLNIKEYWESIQQQSFEQEAFDDLLEQNHSLYRELLKSFYDKSYANPTYAVKLLGEEYGSLFSFLYTELRAVIADISEGRILEFTITAELLIEIYNMFEAEIPYYKQVKDTIYWFISDYADILYSRKIREAFDPELSFAKRLITQVDLKDLRYLFRYGEYISEWEWKLASFINQLSQSEVDEIAAVYTTGFERGFKLNNRDLTLKKTVNIRYPIGLERIVLSAIQQFQQMGLETTIYRYGVHSITKNRNQKIGFFATSVNKQYEYDHRFDEALYLDKALYERKIAVLKATLEKYKELAKGYAGTAVIEIFGEEPFEPAAKKESCSLSEKQRKLISDFTAQSSEIYNEYIPQDEISFTIIAFPTPQIGPSFSEIFMETIKLNSLKNEVYLPVQQKIIDALDQADYVQVLGENGNHTDLRISLKKLKNPLTETKFENCVADVNIPLGEVFTSPVLKGTTGTLFVKRVYLKGLLFRDLEITFKDGWICEYQCSNFGTVEENQAYIYENILKNKDTLPMGEFAIGTNTLAYVMAMKYNIFDKLPILIVEKMGPHFAVGDTCYCRAEDIKVYNPDGKEIVARENECSMLRDTEPDKAYFNCHTDITIPYDEIGEISCYCENGTRIKILEHGKFVLDGTELLNQAFSG